jgi:hypothetical protein
MEDEKDFILFFVLSQWFGDGRAIAKLPHGYHLEICLSIFSLSSSGPAGTASVLGGQTDGGRFSQTAVGQELIDSSDRL